uniref:La1-like protein n=1 Tax=Hadrurus spadix TaxID=141984 RepID=A0A1W7RA90_9SCOR
MAHALTPILFGILLMFSFSSLSTGYGESCQAGKYTIHVGRSVQDSKSCILYKCINYNRRYSLETLTCAKMTLKSGCRYVPGPATARFPDCCPMVVCRGSG